MKRLGLTLALLACAALASDETPRARDGRGRLPRGGLIKASAVAVVKSIENNIQAGDKVGNWLILKTDGTSLTGSAITMTPQHSPGVSPLTFNGTNQFYLSSNIVAFPAGDFTFICSLNPSTLGFSTAAELGGKWTGGTLDWLVELAPTTGVLTGYVKTSGGTITNAHSTAITAGAWQAFALSYNATTHVSTMRIGGVNTTQTGSGTLNNDSIAIAWFALDANGAFPFPGSSRGCFLTETALSAAREDAIMAGVL